VGKPETAIWPAQTQPGITPPMPLFPARSCGTPGPKVTSRALLASHRPAASNPQPTLLRPWLRTAPLRLEMPSRCSWVRIKLYGAGLEAIVIDSPCLAQRESLIAHSCCVCQQAQQPRCVKREKMRVESSGSCSSHCEATALCACSTRRAQAKHDVRENKVTGFSSTGNCGPRLPWFRMKAGHVARPSSGSV